MIKFKLAFDRSARRVDVDGRLHIDRSHISKAAVNPYYGREIPGYAGLGLDPDKVYRLLRDPVELERGAHTFARLPVLSVHEPITVDTLMTDAEQKKLIVGAIGSDVAFNAPYLDADLCIWDATAIAGIETDKVRELSCGYRYVPVMEAGEFEGKPYDGRMTEIVGNHLALVEVGRAGSDVVVADRNPFPKKEPATMKMTKLGKALYAALAAVSPVLAADSAVPAMVATVNRKNVNAADLKSKLMALDADVNPEQLDTLIDAIIGVEDEPKAVELPKPAAVGDESPADKVRAMLAGKVEDAVIEQILGMIAAPAADEYDSGMKKEEVEAAMDAASAKLRAQLLAANEACREVRPVVGEVYGMDSAADVYAFALDQMKVDRKGVEGDAALRAIFKAASAAKNASPTHIAQDSASVLAKFPGVARIRQA